MYVLPVLKSLFCFSLLTPVGGGIPHGVLPEMGPGGNVGQLTEHRPRWTGKHETVQSPPDTMQKRKAQADTEARQGARATSSGLADPTESKNKGGKRGGVSWAPNLAKDLSVSGSVSDSLTDIVTAAHLDPVSAEVQDQAVKTAGEPEATQARKFSVDASANRKTARPRRESAGEHRCEMKTFLSSPKKKTPPPQNKTLFPTITS